MLFNFFRKSSYYACFQRGHQVSECDHAHRTVLRQSRTSVVVRMITVYLKCSAGAKYKRVQDCTIVDENINSAHSTLLLVNALYIIASGNALRSALQFSSGRHAAGSYCSVATAFSCALPQTGTTILWPLSAEI